MISTFCVLAVLAAAPAAAPAPVGAAPSTPLEQATLQTYPVLNVLPANVDLTHPRFGQALVVSAKRPDGFWTDLSPDVRWTPADPKVVAFTDGRLVPLRDGITEVTATVAGRTLRVSVTVKMPAADPVVGLRHELQPVLTKNGCNAGACHGAQFGKGGLKISLFGSDPDGDRLALSRDAAGRRINPADPDAGLLISKPTGRVPHEGGVRLERDGREVELLRRWVREGCPGEAETAVPELTSLEVLPAERTWERLGERQRLVVMAGFSDGTRRDVTRDARFDTNQAGVATVEPDGTVTVRGRGEAAIMIRWLGRATVFRALVVRQDAGWRPFADEPYNFIDGLVYEKLKRMRFTPSPLCTDEEFIRRATLDATGTLPTVDEVRAFLADASPSRQKREKLVDDLLTRTAFVDWWTLKWGDWLRNTGPDERTRKPMLALHQWLRGAVRDGKPLDRMITELVTARGSTYRDGPANYFRINRRPDDAAEATAQTFLGIRLQCAKCHQHPFEKWTQDDYWGLAAYFARMGTRNDPEYGLFAGAADIVVRPDGEVRNPRTNKVMPPTPLGAGKPWDDPADRRVALARWMVDGDPPPAARNFANRIWAAFLGRGIVEPVDDVRDTNPPTNSALLDGLARRLVADGWDFRKLVRAIMTSRTYQHSSMVLPSNAEDTMGYARFYPRRLAAEQLLDAVCTVTGVPEKFNLLPAGTRAVQLPDPETPSRFLDLFGRPKREQFCECEREGDPNMAQALHLISGDLINTKLASPTGRVAALLKSAKPDDEVLEEFYLATLSRKPTADERRIARELLKGAPTRKEGLEDLLWTLCNCKEFLFNR